MVERTGEKGWFLACNSALYFALVRYGVQAKQRLAEATAAEVRFIGTMGFFLYHIRSVSTSRSLLVIAHTRAVKL